MLKKDMSIWPLLVALVILALGVALFHILPAVFDFGNGFKWGVVGFLVLYVLAAAYLYHTVPGVNEISHLAGLAETTSNDIVVRSE